MFQFRVMETVSCFSSMSWSLYHVSVPGHGVRKTDNSITEIHGERAQLQRVHVGPILQMNYKLFEILIKPWKGMCTDCVMKYFHLNLMFFGLLSPCLRLWRRKERMIASHLCSVTMGRTTTWCCTTGANTPTAS